MSKNNELLKNTVVITIGKIATQFISFFLLPLYTALLTTEEYGTIDLFTTYTSLLLPLIIFQIDQAFFRFLIDVRKDEEYKKKIISTVLFFSIIQCFLVIVIFIIFSKYIDNKYKWFLLINIISAIISSLMLQVARGFGKNIVYSFSSFLSAFIQIVFNLIFIAILKWGAIGMFVATFLGNIVCGVYIFVSLRVYKYLSIKKFDIAELKRMLKFSLPLIPNAVSWWAVGASDKVIVAAYMGVAANGILSIAHKFSSFYISFYNIFNLSWTESAALHINDEDKEEFFSGVINTMFRLFIGVALIIIAIIPFIFSIMINGKYSEAYNQIPIFMLASMFNVVIGLYSVIYVALKKTREIANTSIFSGIINIVINLMLIKYIGLYAASIASAFAYGIMAIYRYIDVKKYIEVKLDKKIIISTICMFIIINYGYYYGNIITQLIIFVTACIYTVLTNINMLLTLISLIRNKFKKHMTKSKGE